MGAAFLCAISGIANENTERNTTAYIQNWISKLEEDSPCRRKRAKSRGLDCWHLVRECRREYRHARRYRRTGHLPGGRPGSIRQNSRPLPSRETRREDIL